MFMTLFMEDKHINWLLFIFEKLSLSIIIIKIVFLLECGFCLENVQRWFYMVTKSSGGGVVACSVC